MVNQIMDLIPLYNFDSIPPENSRQILWHIRKNHIGCLIGFTCAVVWIPPFEFHECVYYFLGDLIKKNMNQRGLAIYSSPGQKSANGQQQMKQIDRSDPIWDKAAKTLPLSSTYWMCVFSWLDRSLEIDGRWRELLPTFLEGIYYFGQVRE